MDNPAERSHWRTAACWRVVAPNRACTWAGDRNFSYWAECGVVIDWASAVRPAASRPIETLTRTPWEAGTGAAAGSTVAAVIGPRPWPEEATAGTVSAPATTTDAQSTPSAAIEARGRVRAMS